MINLKETLNNQYVRYFLILFVGVTIGALFYPTKRIEEKITQKYEQQISSIKEQHSKETKELTDKFELTVKTEKTKVEESERKISKLTSEVKNLQSKQKISTYKIVKPDGTIEERTFTETDVNESTKVITKVQEEFKNKITQIENTYAKVHRERVENLKKEFDSKEQQYQKTISELQKSKTVSVNEKSFGLEVGVLSNKDYYGHATMDLWGPVFVGVHGQMGQNNNNALGAGLGIRF
jgi:uncharacterized membrane-anchored protein YhcB (DUF1043 family)